MLLVLNQQVVEEEVFVLVDAGVKVVAVAEGAAVAATEGYGWRLAKVLWTQVLPIV